MNDAAKALLTLFKEKDNFKGIDNSDVLAEVFHALKPFKVAGRAWAFQNRSGTYFTVAGNPPMIVGDYGDNGETVAYETSLTYEEKPVNVSALSEWLSSVMRMAGDNYVSIQCECNDTELGQDHIGIMDGYTIEACDDGGFDLMITFKNRSMCSYFIAQDAILCCWANTITSFYDNSSFELKIEILDDDNTNEEESNDGE